MIVADLSIAPHGVGTSLSRYVKAAVAALKGSGLPTYTNPMGTVLEAPDLASIFRAVEMAHDAVREAGGERIYFVLKVDARYDTDASARKKLESIGEEL